MRSRSEVEASLALCLYVHMQRFFVVVVTYSPVLLYS